MIIGTDKNKDDIVGQIVTLSKMTDDQGILHYNVRAMFMRKATMEEYVNSLKEQNIPYPHESRLVDAFFYEISID